MSLSPLLHATRDGLLTGAPDIERLYELGKRRQWNATDLPWHSLDFTAVPSEVRQGLGEMLALTHYGELGALTASARLVSSSPHLIDRLFGATQVTDEARHVEWFSRLLFSLGAAPQVKPSVAAFVDEVTTVDDEVALLVGMNILIEGLAQTLMLEAGKALSEVALEGFESLAMVGRWLTDRLACDESRHLAFGITRVAELIGTLAPARRLGVERTVERWTHQLLGFCQERSLATAQFGIDGDAFLLRCAQQTQSRLAHAGLTVELS